jgi:hypothetical protein
MAYPTYIREKVRALRTERHLSIVEIAARLGLPKTTVYYRVRDLPLGRPRRSSNLAATRAMQRRYRLIREQAYAEGAEQFDRLAIDPTFRDFVCVYMAEGSKRARNVVAIGNSDPSIVKLAARWMREFSKKKLRYSIQFHADQDLGTLTAFWAGELGVGPESITSRGLDGLSQGNVGLDSTPVSGRGEAWYRTRFGAGRARVRIPPPRFAAGPD